ncbi:MAG: hydrogenobyrinic acid a,c-diamide synthase (glutamine-hydrolyzing) [Gammaproteobacteria bacterium]|nr:hydrogenobyrinic acid a,c-diamide synthase (glutamine-hydrolyzing) [Gammaproteobacteria bacterium]MCW8923736.1 hydrogenobyrinic acid a,c-diamide synthase (glutamine-hydrolyzing) [Gammaproteobacteria bacterium]
MSRFFISAAHKSSGKTTVSIGLCAALSEKGKLVQPFKKGPDYIDPQWLARASSFNAESRHCFNLDFYTMTPDEILETIALHSADADISLIEGNKGLYDGLDLDGSNSNAALAKLTQTPIILVLDTRGVTRGVAPLILGYQSFDNDINIQGVILNQLGGSRHEEKLRRVIEHYTDVQVVGAIHKDKRFDIDERHLGLLPSHEDPQSNEKIELLKRAIIDQVDLDRIIGIANDAPKLEIQPSGIPVPAANKDIRIGIVHNTAFSFYYPDDLISLEQAGAELVYIDNITDSKLPEIDGLFIGGGFPETHLQELEANQSIRQDIHQAIENGLPVYAECGGLMYLARTIKWQDQKNNMVGSIPGDIIMEDKPQGRGYVQLKETAEGLWPLRSDGIISAHEFHYSRFENLDKNARFAFEVVRGTGINGKNDGYIYKNLLACYTHQRGTSKNRWTQRFVDFIRQQKT